MCVYSVLRLTPGQLNVSAPLIPGLRWRETDLDGDQLNDRAGWTTGIEASEHFETSPKLRLGEAGEREARKGVKDNA